LSGLPGLSPLLLTAKSATSSRAASGKRSRRRRGLLCWLACREFAR
jgi:hypothetical protein